MYTLDTHMHLRMGINTMEILCDNMYFNDMLVDIMCTEYVLMPSIAFHYF